MDLKSHITSNTPKRNADKNKIYSNDKIKNLVKSHLQKYIESFFSDTGQNKDLLGIVSPRMLQYNTDKSFDEKQDYTRKKLQVARATAELASIVPAVIIADGGVESVSDSIGSITGAGSIGGMGGQWYGKYNIFKRVPITLICATRDIEELDSFAGLISLMFNELRNLAGGSEITGNLSEGDTYVIVLQHSPVNISSPSSVDVPRDQLLKIWYAEAALDVYFQDEFIVKKSLPEINVNKQNVNTPNLMALHKPEIMVSSHLSVNAQHMILIKNLGPDDTLIVSDPKKATVTSDFYLTPRSIGPITLRVIDKRTREIRAEKEVTFS